MDMNPQVLLAATGILGSVIGVTAASFSNYLIAKWRGQDDEKARTKVMSVSLAAEMQSVLQIERSRQWRSEYRDAVTDLRGADAEERKRIIKLDARVESAAFPPFAVFDHYVPQLGLLGPLAGDVVEFYTEFRMLEGASSSFSSEVYVEEISAHRLADVIEEIQLNLDRIIVKAETTISMLRKNGET